MHPKTAWAGRLDANCGCAGTARGESIFSPAREPCLITCHLPTPLSSAQVEYAIQDMGYLRFYLAPKIEDEDMEGEDEAP